MKYKLDTHMKFEVLWWLLSEIVVHFLSLLTSFFYEDNKFYNNEGRIFSLTKFEQLPYRGFEEIYSQRLTICPHIWNW